MPYLLYSVSAQIVTAGKSSPATGCSKEVMLVMIGFKLQWLRRKVKCHSRQLMSLLLLMLLLMLLFFIEMKLYLYILMLFLLESLVDEVTCQ